MDRKRSHMISIADTDAISLTYPLRKQTTAGMTLWDEESDGRDGKEEAEDGEVTDGVRWTIWSP
jgi:hypothetical protein